IVIEYRDAEGNLDLVPDLTAELLELRVALIVAAPSSVAVPVERVTQTLPIVVAYGDPLAQGLVTNLARPGGNVTGLSAATTEVSAKRLELLKETLPGISRVAVIRQAGGTDTNVQETEAAARALGLRLQVLRVGDPNELQAAFAAMSAEHAEALVV